MCGIFGYIGKKSNSAKIVLEGLKSLEYRGYDSWGVAVVPDNNIALGNLIQNNGTVIKKKQGKIGNAHVDDLPEGTMSFGHTRWATHGKVSDINAHPHIDCTGKFAIIHNGIIENHEELKKDLIAKGHKFVSETDTEVAIHLFEEICKTTKSHQEAFRKMFLQLEGMNAIIILDSIHRSFFAAALGSPLVLGYGNNEYFFASDASALIPHLQLVHFLEEHEYAKIDEKNIVVFDLDKDESKIISQQKLTWSVEQTSLGTYPHYMIKEIYDQPAMINKIARDGIHQEKQLIDLLKNSFGSYVIGCGTAAHAALAGTYLFSKISQKHLNWAIGSEFGYHLEFLTKGSLVIALSQSGETMDTIEAVKKAKAKGATIVSLVNIEGSTLYRLSNQVILIGAGPEKSVASTKAFVAKLAHLLLLAYTTVGKAEAGQAVLQQAAAVTKKILEPESIKRITQLAREIKNKEHAYVIGRGLSYPASLETALKIKEISYIHAEGLAAGELKHGPLALVENDTPCIVFVPKDETESANLAAAQEMKARGGTIIGISYKNHDVFDRWIEVEDAQEGTIIPNVVVGQLLAYYLTLEKNLDPDKPRNLAKSVTVK